MTDTGLKVEQNARQGVLRGERIGVPPTEDELLRAVGYTPETHRVVWSQAKQWPTSMKDKDGEPMQVINYYLWLKIEPQWDSILASQDGFRAELLSDIRAEAAGARDPAPDRPRSWEASDKRAMVEIDVFDPHFQKLAWGPETGNNWDLKLTAEAYRNAARDLIHESVTLGLDIERWLFVIGQDLFHTDNDQYATASGTLQDVDSRTPKAARIVRKLLTDVILDMLEHAPVDVMNVPGNHAPDRDWFMGEIIDARFEGNPNVSVDNRPVSRKYYRYGNALIGFSHGKDEKPDKLRDYMSQEARKDWGDTIFREWHVGHWHHESVKDHRGVLVRIMPSISGTDAWHHRNGFVHAQRGAKALVWTPDRGMRHTIHHAIPLTEQEMGYTAPLLRGDR